MKISFREHGTPKDCDFFVIFILVIKFERLESDNVRVKISLRAKKPLPTP